MLLARRDSRVRLGASSDSAAPVRHRRRVIRLQTRCEATTWLVDASQIASPQVRRHRKAVIEQPAHREAFANGRSSIGLEQRQMQSGSLPNSVCVAAGLQRRRQLPIGGVTAFVKLSVRELNFFLSDTMEHGRNSSRALPVLVRRHVHT
jgi:hypothetical protein